ncbi:MAG: peptidase C11 [Prevotellaceae bacterium]|jgi:hypothetical protein|nr:peptidase C11 [Prevotellaceae bacterium]
MKHFIKMGIALPIFLLIASCKHKEDEPATPQPTRTVLVYVAADNSLSPFANSDLKEMKEGFASVTNSGAHLLIYIDTGSSPRLIELQNKKGTVTEVSVKTYGENRNSVGVTETREVFADVFDNPDYKADSYGLIYWSHGDGWIPNPLPETRWVGQDQSTRPSSYMNISDLTAVLSTAPYFDFILFDACFMSSVEVAYAVRSYTDYYIASPTEIPGPGAMYDRLVPALFITDDQNPDPERPWEEHVAKAYFTPYALIYDSNVDTTNDHWTGGVSICMIQTSRLESLANIIYTSLTGATADAATLRATVFDYDQRTGTSHVGYYDLVDMMQQILPADNASRWYAMTYWATTGKNYSVFAGDGYGGLFSMEGSNGISCYIPSGADTNADRAYQQTEWYTAAGLSQIGW